MTSNAILPDPVLQGALQSIGEHYQKLIDDLTKKNSALEDENRYVNEQMVSLQDQVEKLTQELYDCNEELANTRHHEAPPPTDYDSELMKKLLAASSQIIHAKDEVRSLDQQNRLLEEEREQNRTALDVSRRDAEEARQKLEEVEAQLLAAQREIAQVKSSQTTLEDRLESERKAYERSARNKDQVIKELEDRITILEKENDKPDAAEKENEARSPLQESNALPSDGLPVASSSKPTFEGRYKQLRKQFELLESQYDSLRQTHIAEIEKFEATRARWAKYKTSILEGVAKIDGSSKKKPKPGVGTLPPAMGSPLARVSRPAEEAINTPNTAVRHSARSSRIRDVVDKINEADVFDEVEGLNRPYHPRISALQLQMDDVRSPTPIAAPSHVEPMSSPLRLSTTTRAGAERSSPVLPRPGDPMNIPEDRPQRAGSPAETESEPGLSQSPFARLRLFEEDHIDIVPSDHPRALRDAARPLPEQSPNARHIGREDGSDTEMERVEMVGDVTSPISHRLPAEEEEVSFLRTVHKRAQTSGPPSTSTPANQAPRFSALEAAFFIKQEPIDDDIEDPDVTVVAPEVSFTPGPKRKSLQSEKSRADIRAKLLGSKKVVTPRAGLSIPAARESSTPRVAGSSVLGKRKGLEVETPGAGPSRPHPATAPASKRLRDSEMPPPSEQPRRGYDQYKGRGRYAQSARTEQPINALFEIDTSRNGGLDFQYDDVVRNKEERRRMEATDCECCRDYYEVVGHLPQQRNGPQWRSPTPSLARSPKKRRCAMHEGQVGSGGSPVKRANSDPTLSPTKRKRTDQHPAEQVQQHRQNISRHRQNWVRQTTPPDYWDIGFPTTQQIVSINQRAEENYAAKRAHIEQEANKKDGRYKWR
ncbi:hypothetical protein FRC01_003099 [Tulasnella sp. 417]|nr:hypothetical protein FRC01_003099 [Tulasnella sp. 417]